MSFEMDRKQFTQMFGPTVGDSVRLGDTNLFARIERDLTVHGQESKFGGGKVLRDGMGVNATETRENNHLVADTIISDATIIIEVSEKSGTKHQGWEALRLGRQLFIMENVLNDKISWAEEMLNYGAQVLTNDNFEFLIESIPYLTKKKEYVF